MTRPTCNLIPIAEQIWDLKYRFRTMDGTIKDRTVEDTWQRVASGAAKAESGRKKDRKLWEERFYEAMADFAFLPAGRILAGAGTGRKVTLFNCFVMGRIEDDLGSIFKNLREAALTMQQGGGIGHDFSTLRPSGALVKSIGAEASGPVSFMDVWDAMCRTIMSAGARRGAMMGTMRCDHPDIEDFIAAKAEAGRLRNFNLSVLVTDAFIDAVRRDAQWDLVFGGEVYRTLSARALWERIMRATFHYAEPGVIFIDRINARNNLGYCEEIIATNPCGEQPLPPHGACLLGSINLTRLVQDPFTPGARLDLQRLDSLATTAVRFLDNIIDVSNFPLKAQAREAEAKRRIGLGITGLADALAMMGLHYGSEQGRRAAGSWMARLQRSAYLASSDLAAERSAFPLFEKEKFLAAPGPAAMDDDLRRTIAKQGMRNGLVTSIAPTGTISLFAGNVSSGIEPVFDFTYKRRILSGSSGRKGAQSPAASEHAEIAHEEIVEDYAYRRYQQHLAQQADIKPGVENASARRDAERGNERFDERREPAKRAELPESFVTAMQLPPSAHLQMQAALQPHVDSSISKTINCPADISFAAFKDIYIDAYDLGLKGCTTFRPNEVTGSVLMPAEQAAAQAEDSDAPVSPAEGTAEKDLGASGENKRQAAPLATSHATPGAVQPMKNGDIVYMAQPLAREPVMEGKTYKLKWPGSDHAIYVTINDLDEGGRKRPFEIFINSKNLEHYAWTVALTRMISAVFRRGGDVTFVVEELKAVFDPQGGQWMNSHYVPSLLAAIGEIIEAHMISSGFLTGKVEDGGSSEAIALSGSAKQGFDAQAVGEVGVTAGAPEHTAAAPGPKIAATAESTRSLPGKFCPRCGQPALVRNEGCWICRDCGYSRCS